jgi:hypothetical protein
MPTCELFLNYFGYLLSDETERGIGLELLYFL